jgi:deazaflavin-dependent oxidoreductase (nitroreductase family)
VSAAGEGGSGGARVTGGTGNAHKPRLGRRMARFNKRVLNKVTIHVAGRLPFMGIVIHVGRRTGTVYRTPVNVFRTDDGFRFALTYGQDAEWVKNALAFGAVRLVTRHREHELTGPVLVRDPEGAHVPRAAHVMLRIMRVSVFLDFRSAT